MNPATRVPPAPSVDELRSQLAAHRVRFIAKSDSRLMRSLALPLALIGNRVFMDRYWTTIARTVYYPTRVADPWDWPEVIEHELIHVRQWRRWWFWFWVSYLLLPLPFGLAWCRWRWEREAYLPALRRHPEALDDVVRSLWYGYGRPWPRRWMRRWFARELHRESPGAVSSPERNA